jgi:ribosomal protein S18 acetylase RimI-like enzyme
MGRSGGVRVTHPLDRPAWSALTSRQADLAVGDSRALRFDGDYAIFAAARDGAPENQAALAALMPDGGALALIEAAPVPAPALTADIRPLCHQMTAPSLKAGGRDLDMAPLTDADGPEALALATLTQPGPFFRKTHLLGGFVGVKHDGRLVAMAGERLKPDGFTEVSGVCTHPDFRGRGYAGALMRAVAQRVLERGEVPFLHVYAHNAGAIALYESLGFRFRSEMTFLILTSG